MKKSRVWKVVYMGILSLVFSLIGCKSENSSENRIRFSTFSEEQQQKYAEDYLKDKYQIDFKEIEVYVKQKNAIKNEDFYFAYAITQDDKRLDFWISPTGEVVDAMFMWEIKESIDTYVEKNITKVFPACKIVHETRLTNPPSREWYNSENIDDFLRTEPTYTTIRIFIEDMNMINEDSVNQIVEQFPGCDGRVYVYYSEYLDVDSINYADYIIAKDLNGDK